MRKLLTITLFGSLFTITTPQSTFNNSREEPVQVFNSRGNELIGRFFAFSMIISGEPSVECSVDRVIIKLKTNRPFWGRIYAAGHSKDSECLMDYSGMFSIPFTSTSRRRHSRSRANCPSPTMWNATRTTSLSDTRSHTLTRHGRLLPLALYDRP